MRSMNFTRLFVLLLILLCLLGASFSAIIHQDKPTYKPTGGEATLLGTISFVGTPPEPFRINTSADSVCEKFDPLLTDWIVVENHKLANVVIYVRGESLNSYLFEAPSPDVTLEHNGCRYVPHATGLVRKPRILSKLESVYTEEARQNQITGTVVLSAVFSETGEVTDIQVIRGLSHGLNERAIDAAKRITFVPA